MMVTKKRNDEKNGGRRMFGATWKVSLRVSIMCEACYKL